MRKYAGRFRLVSTDFSRRGICIRMGDWARGPDKRPARADPETARLLALPAGSALLNIRRLCVFRGTPRPALDKLRIRGDMYEFEVSMYGARLRAGKSAVPGKPDALGITCGGNNSPRAPYHLFVRIFRIFFCGFFAPGTRRETVCNYAVRMI